jgi:hypothetical protein
VRGLATSQGLDYSKPMTTATLKTNKYPAPCTNCKTYLEVGEGSIERVDGKWVARCLDGETCGERADAAQTPAEPKSYAASSASIAIADIPEGVYAVEGRLYQIDHPKGGGWEGWTFVKHIDMKLEGTTATGKPKVKKTKLGKAAQAKPGCGATFYGTQAAADIAIIVDDPLAAAKLVGKTTSICGCCSAALEDPVSVERGIGPVCWKKWGF